MDTELVRRRSNQPGGHKPMSGNSNEDAHIIPRFSNEPMGLDGPNRAVQFHPDVPHRREGAQAPSEAGESDEFLSESKLLIVGKDMGLKGAEISDCDRLVVKALSTAI